MMMMLMMMELWLSPLCLLPCSSYGSCCGGDGQAVGAKPLRHGRRGVGHPLMSVAKCLVVNILLLQVQGGHIP